MLNKAMVIGYLGKDPEVRYTGSGKAVANFSVATSEKWTDSSGAKQEKTTWFRVVVWDKLAENCGQYLKKGRPVYCEGKIEEREWDDKEGNKRTTWELVANRVVFLPSAQDQGQQPAQGQRRGPPAGVRGSAAPPDSKDAADSYSPPSYGDDDVPF